MSAAVVVANDDDLATGVQSKPLHRFAFLQDSPAVLYGGLGWILSADPLGEQTELIWGWPPDQLEPVGIIVTIDPPGVDQLRIQEAESQQSLDSGDAINVDADEVIQGDANGSEPLEPQDVGDLHPWVVGPI